MLLAVCWVTLAVPAQKESARDSIAALETDSVVLPKVSLLTCSPGVEIWQQYGHTAIRFEDTASDLDVVFNYGLFSFDQPHFIWRFCLGATDYVVGAAGVCAGVRNRKTCSAMNVRPANRHCKTQRVTH